MTAIAIDYNGTISEDPATYGKMMAAWKIDPHVTVYIVTGTQTLSRTALLDAGIGPDVYTEIVILPKGHLAAEKAVWLSEHTVDIFFDNSLANCQAATAAGVKLAFVPVTVRETQRSAVKNARDLLR